MTSQHEFRLFESSVCNFTYETDGRAAAMNPRARAGREAAAASTAVWMWQSDDGKAYNPFNPEYSSALEQALKSGQQFLDVPERMWRFDLRSMTQVSTKPGGTSREIKRYQESSTVPRVDQKKVRVLFIMVLCAEELKSV